MARIETPGAADKDFIVPLDWYLHRGQWGDEDPDSGGFHIIIGSPDSRGSIDLHELISYAEGLTKADAGYPKAEAIARLVRATPLLLAAVQACTPWIEARREDEWLPGALSPKKTLRAIKIAMQAANGEGPFEIK